MQESLTTLFYFLSPIFCIDVGVRIFGIDLLDLARLGFLAVFFVLWFSTAMQGRARRISGIDLAILTYCGWCIAISLVYIDQSRFADVAKFVFPL